MSQTQQPSLRIGAVASATGLTPDAIRYYERLGLLAKPARSAGRFRVYSQDAIDRVQFIKQAQRLGLELQEIRHLLAPVDGHRRQQCRRVRTVLAKHLAQVETRLRELESFRETLRSAIAQCDRALHLKETIACPVMTRLGNRAT